MKHLAVAAALAASGCVLLALDPDDYSRECAFEGKETPCGTCITESCQADVNACCGDTVCGLTMKYTVDACVPRATCTVLARTEPTSDSPTAEERLGLCVTRHCAAVCGVR